MDQIILVSNPGSASRKYSLYKGADCLARLHFEYDGETIVYQLKTSEKTNDPASAEISHLTFSASKASSLFAEQGYSQPPDKIGLRIVAPDDYFQTDQLLDQTAIQKLKMLEPRASLHINSVLQELHLLQQIYPNAKLIGISDSAFHKTMPNFSRHYGIPHQDAKRYGIWRFGYHGLSVEAVVEGLKKQANLPLRLVVCHLGSGSSVTAVENGQSLDTTMGYSPLEGLVMATRSGNLDITAAQALQAVKKFDNQALQEYLNYQSGLIGLSGRSSDIRELLKIEDQEDQTKLALQIYVNRIQQAIGQMAATLGGLDALVFTGTVGERSVEIRKRIIRQLMFLGLALDNQANQTADAEAITRISPDDHPAKIYIVPTDEDSMIAAKTLAFSK